MRVNKRFVRFSNERKVLQQVFNNGKISRSQISKNLKLNKVTVSEIVSELLSKSYLKELGHGSSTKNGGRKPTILQFNSKLGYIISFDIGYDYVDCMINLLNGNIVHVDRFPAINMDIMQRLNLMIHYANNIMFDNIPLLGVSVAIHGIVEDNKVVYTPFVDYKNIDIVDFLQDNLKVPVVIQNEANLAVIYERDFEYSSDADNIVCISIHKGIGAGIIINNELYTGKHGEAGEIGHTVIYDHNFYEHKSLTTVENICSEDAVLDIIRKQIKDKNFKKSDIIKEYNDGNKLIIDIMNDFCYHIAHVIYNTIISFAPKKVALNSNLIASIPTIFENIKLSIPYLTGYESEVCLVKDVNNAILLGGCSNIIHKILNMEGEQLIFERID